MKLTLKSTLPLDVAVSLAEAWWNGRTSERREHLVSGMKRDGFDADDIEEALIFFEENDTECRGQFLNSILDALADMRRGGSSEGITLQ